LRIEKNFFTELRKKTRNRKSLPLLSLISFHTCRIIIIVITTTTTIIIIGQNDDRSAADAA